MNKGAPQVNPIDKSLLSREIIFKIIKIILLYRD